MSKVNRKNISEFLLEKQLSIIGKTVKDAIDYGPQWRMDWEWSRDEANEFIEYAIPLIKKTFKCNKAKAQSTLDYFLIMFGIKVYN